MRWIDQICRNIQVNVEEDNQDGVKALRWSAQWRFTLRLRETYCQEDHQIVLDLEPQEGFEMDQPHSPMPKH